MTAYPIKFEPILQEKIWGGSKLKSLLNKKTTSDVIGESWEISGVEGHISVVNNGVYKGCSITDLIRDHRYEFVGNKNYSQFGNDFPLLIKYLDAKTDLSVQVHPDDEMAKAEHNAYGKTEMWYIMDREADATIINGFKNENVTTNALKTLTKDNVDQILNKQKVNKGESFFIPAGKVHAIGAGVLAAEIQQTSDITYRIYDWDRKDVNGNERELHLEKSLKAVKRNIPQSNSTAGHNSYKNARVLASCPYFTSTVIQIDQETSIDYSQNDSFVIYMCVEGSFEISVNDSKEKVSFGETVLVPANARQVLLETQAAKIIELYIK
ncbi:mannose-6-phosphate isomerase [Nonlabens sp. MB-3u-79]|uniref:type I phosphomannose isomerase catalytic subunit n=1 Tax=Nonlabens sp. MB-3u-79 TaxID=2058134 RepID=UPI000C30E181|nr:type I phosphomannose isomerase catalytic subunit [Nonlabens sp. MB-3u-79]AUC77933.1 mannose-6-phosphate isomerase [Nonlabens sp. MB-3u-79]